MADRPVECSHCKKPIKVVYKEIVDHVITCTEMCGECPIFQQKLHGHLSGPSADGKTETETGLCCGNCRTTLESIKMGNPLGCSECYAIFGDILIQELIATGKISSRFKRDLVLKKTQTIHIGKSPTKSITITPSSRLTALNEALNEALKRENYEQAAWLRDQIKDLMEKPNDGKPTSS